MSLEWATELFSRSRTTVAFPILNTTASNGKIYIFNNGLKIANKRDAASSTHEALKSVDKHSENNAKNKINPEIVNDIKSTNKSTNEIKISTKKCEVCEKRYEKRHKCKPLKPRPQSSTSYVCDFCDKIFVTLQNREEHYLFHFSKEEEKCPTCKEIVRGKELKEHFKSHVRKYRCSTCEKCFKTKGNIANHQESHKNKRIEKCPECSEIFYNKSDFENHKKIHTNGQKFVCNVCNYKSLTKHQLKLHSRIHSEDNPYCCNYCPAKFPYRPSILNHLKKHKGKSDYTLRKSGGKKVSIKSVRCELCQQMFTSAGIERHNEEAHRLVIEFLNNIDED